MERCVSRCGAIQVHTGSQRQDDGDQPTLELGRNTCTNGDKPGQKVACDGYSDALTATKRSVVGGMNCMTLSVREANINDESISDK